MQRHGIAWYEAEGQAKWLKEPIPGVLIMVDNSDNYLSSLLLWQRVKCGAKHIDTKLYVVKEKVRNFVEMHWVKEWQTCVCGSTY